MEKKYIYDAFISYRHTEPDKFAAERLHKQMEAFKLPGNIAKTKKGRTRIERVFRDKDELPLTNNLEDPIFQALQNSEYLIVICSPRLKESLWCKKEIETFIRLHGREKILAVLIEGEPEEAFPEELLYAEEVIKYPDGTQETLRKPLEPLAADIRGKDKKEMLKAMRTEMLRLLAPMFSLNYDDLRQRHRERRMKRILTGVAVCAAVSLAFGTVSTAMALRIQKQKEQIETQSAEIQEQNAAIWAQSNEIQEQNDILTKKQALALAEEAARILEEGDRVSAIETAYIALTEQEGISLPYTAEAQLALTESLHVYDSGSSIKPYQQMQTTGYVEFIKISPDGQKMISGDSIDNLVLWDVLEGRKICTLTDLDLQTFAESTGGFIEEAVLAAGERGCGFLDNDRIACMDDTGRVWIFGIAEDMVGQEESVPGIFFLEVLKTDPVQALYADAGGRFFVLQYANALQVYRTETMELTAEYTQAESLAFTGDVFFDEEGKYLAFGEKELTEDLFYLYPDCRVTFLNLENGTKGGVLPIGVSYLKDVCFAGGRAFVLSTKNSEDISQNETSLRACNPYDASVYWKNDYLNVYGNSVYHSYAEGVNRLLVTTTYDAYIVGQSDGASYGAMTFGRSIAGCAVYLNSDQYIALTREGEYYVIDGQTADAYYMPQLFQSHSRNVEKFIFAGNGFFVCSFMDNRITYYQYSTGGEVEQYNGELTEKVPEGEKLYLPEVINLAEQYGSGKAGLALDAFYNADESLLGISYADNTFEIYGTADAALLCTLENLPYHISAFLGTDAAGNVYVRSSTYGYMLNSQIKHVATIEGLVEVDVSNNRLILQRASGQLLTVPIYTLEELLAKAEAYVLR